MPESRDTGGGRRRSLAAWAAVVALVLLIPLIAMQFSNEWNWGLFDFVFAGALLFGAALAYELLATKGGTAAYRAGVGVVVLTALVLVWINAAVGIIGDDELFNFMYLGVLAIGLIGALVVRFQPQGMAHVCIMVAIGQMLVPVIVLISPNLRDALLEPPGPVGVFALNAFFVVLWLASAWLFRKATPGAVR